MATKPEMLEEIVAIAAKLDRNVDMEALEGLNYQELLAQLKEYQEAMEAVEAADSVEDEIDDLDDTSSPNDSDPDPEPDEAVSGGAYVVAPGRSVTCHGERRQRSEGEAVSPEVLGVDQDRFAYLVKKGVIVQAK